MDLNMEVHVAGIMENSIVDGPGMRAVLFLQGCPHHCKGCHNPETWDINSKNAEIVTVKELGDRILNIRHINRLTISGGEPFMQPLACVELINCLQDQRCKQNKAPYHIMAYTGYTWEELYASKNLDIVEFLKLVDILVDGPFIEKKKTLNMRFRGSKNQRIICPKESLMLGKIVYSDLN